MGTSNSARASGAALDFGIRATSSSEVSKNTHSVASPIWMLPGQTLFSQASADAASSIRSCAMSARTSIAEGRSLPNSQSCRVSQYSGGLGGERTYVPTSMEDAQAINDSYRAVFNRRPTDTEFSLSSVRIATGATPVELAGSVVARALVSVGSVVR